LARKKDMIEEHLGLYTDMYQLTMGQAYLRDGKSELPACFDYFFRKIPFSGGYVLFAGLADALELLSRLRFGREDISYLRSLGFAEDYLEYLGDFRFSGDIHAVWEGEVVFPLEPVVRVEGRLLEAQIIETLLLNILNFESLVATKASRMRLAAGDRILSDFGLRRAHSFGGAHASRAAVIGGFDSTSNVYAAFRYGLKPAGTQAHSYIESYDDELAAFRKYAEAFPGQCILLVDTYETIESGIPNAIRIAKELEERGHRLLGIRLDSGDLAYLSKKARQMLDGAGLHDVKIVASNLLDEYLIKSLLEQGAPIDIFGVGTKLVTGAPDASLDGVYKLAQVEGEPRLKLSENLFKITLPGRKKVFRSLDDQGFFRADAVVLEGEDEPQRMYHPSEAEKFLDLSCFEKESIFHPVMKGGQLLEKKEKPEEISDYARKRLAGLPTEHKRFENPHIYKVGLSEKLLNMRTELVCKHKF
jgi:nicotinate phosphoribosyltransferase